MMAQLDAQRQQTDRFHDDYKSLGDDRTRQFAQQLTLLKSEAENSVVIRDVLTDAQKIAKDSAGKLEEIQKQGPTLQETHDMVEAMQKKIDQLPDENKKLLQEFLAKMEADWTTFKTEMVQSVVEAMIKQQPAPQPSTPHIEVNTTVNPPPTTLPEQPKADATQKLGDTLPAPDPDPTKPVAGGMPNGLTITPPESKP
jgi:hypothetical protein